MPTLEELERELRALTEARNLTVHNAEALIQRTNREYDRKALSLHRRIERMRPKEVAPEPSQVSRVSQVTHKPRKAKATLALTLEDGYTQEEIDHYNELLSRKAS